LYSICLSNLFFCQKIWIHHCVSKKWIQSKLNFAYAMLPYLMIDCKTVFKIQQNMIKRILKSRTFLFETVSKTNALTKYIHQGKTNDVFRILLPIKYLICIILLSFLLCSIWTLYFSAFLSLSFCSSEFYLNSVVYFKIIWFQPRI